MRVTNAVNFLSITKVGKNKLIMLNYLSTRKPIKT